MILNSFKVKNILISFLILSCSCLIKDLLSHDLKNKVIKNKPKIVFAEDRLLFDAINQKDIKQVKNLLKNKNLNLNLENEYGLTPLMAAQGSIEILKLLSDYGADIDYQNSRGQTALMCLAGQDEYYNSFYDSLKFFLENLL